LTQPPKYAQKYHVKDNCLYETIPGKNSSTLRKLCNLVPEIVCEITVDDGAVTTTYVRLRGVHESGRILPEIQIPAADLAGFNWMTQHWGMDCILEVGKTVKDCVRHAIQTTAAHAEKKTVFQVTGWKSSQRNGTTCCPVMTSKLLTFMASSMATAWNESVSRPTYKQRPTCFG